MDMSGIEHFSESKNIARVSAGFRGGDFFKNPLTARPMSIVEGWPSEVLEKLKHTPIKQATPTDPWNSRR